MTDQTAKQLIKQIKIMNFWISLFGMLIIVSAIIIGILLFKVVTFAQSTSNNITVLKTKTEQTLNVKDDLCKNSLLTNQDFCKQ